jgi:tetratricopeptide (TPR) repeat protein
VLKASIYALEGKNLEALATLNRGIERHPEDIGLQLMKIQVEAVDRNFDAAVNNYRALIARHPDKKELNDGYIELLSGIGRPEQAEAALREVVAKYPTDAGAKLKLIDFLGRRDAVEAEKTLKQFIEAQPAEIPLQSRLADLYWSQKRYTDAQAVLNHIIELDKAGKDGRSAKVKLARISLVQNDAKTAEALVDQVLAADNANSEALLLRAGFRLSRNESDAAIADLRIVVKDNPGSDTALVMLAQAYRQNGAPDLAESTLRKALELNPANLPAALPLARKMIQGNELERAEEVINKALKANPENPDALQLLAQVRALKKDWAGAQAVATELGKLPKGSAAADWISGVIFASQGNFHEAIKKYQASLQANPESAEAIRSLAQAYVAIGDRTQLIKYLKGFLEKNPRALEAHLALSRVYADEKKWDDALVVLDNALKVDPKAAATYKTLAAVYAAQNKPDDAVKAYRTGLTELPDSITLMMALGEQYERMNDPESAMGIYRALVEKHPTYDLAANNLAALLTDYRTDRESLTLASKLSERFSTSPNPMSLDTYGWLALQLGEKEKAISALKIVVSTAPEVSVFHYHLGMAYYQTADRTRARTELERALSLAGKKVAFPGIEHAEKLLKELSTDSTGTK